ncbi:hypothetical protein [Bordetella genomosp. 13]|nr:hypothetical protein [Bordetella genomosp. 13]
MNAEKNYVDYSDDRLKLVRGAITRSMPASEITQIDFCTMDDEIHHGDEDFYIVHGKARFWIMGPFVAGAGRAIDDLVRTHPDIPRRDMAVENMPWKLRSPGALGLRLFPVAGLGEFLPDYLPRMRTKEQ